MSSKSMQEYRVTGDVKVLYSILEVRHETRLLRAAGKTIALVPTMGALHAGHLSLVRLARQHADIVFATVFVNPTQFNDPKDFEHYPTTMEADLTALRGEGVFAVFTPPATDIYGNAFQTSVAVRELQKVLEGPSRPGHFDAVATVCSILFNVVQPDFAIFGEKDFQQLTVLERMVADLQMPLKIVRAPLIRDFDGLALSSRNVRLTQEARALALGISAGLRQIVAAFEADETSTEALRNVFLERLGKHPLIEPDYVDIVDELTLRPRHHVVSGMRAIATVTVGGVRLLDNMALPSIAHLR